MASNEDLKQAIYENLMNALNSNVSIRNQGEENLKKLQFIEGYGVYLAEIIINQCLDTGLRQMAAVMLKQYAEKNWCLEDTEENSIPIASNEAKIAIKTILPEGLYDQNSKIRNHVAYTISTIASYDPSDWKELFDIIVKCLNGNQNSVDGAMKVLVEFTYELQEQVKEVGPMILSEVYRIFEAETVYSVKVRSCAVDILNSLLKCINTQIESKVDQANMLNPILPTFLGKLVQGITASGATSSFGLKKEIVKVLTYLLAEMPKFIVPFMAQILPSIWQLLTETADIYIKHVVNSTDNAFGPDDDDADEGGKKQFIDMILQIFEFIHTIIESRKFKEHIKTVVADLIYIMIIYMQITEDQIEDWTDDGPSGAERFLEDEDEEGVNFSVRSSGQDVLLILGQEFEEKLLQDLSEALTKHILAADADKNAGKSGWWKTYESGMLVVGSFKDVILENEEKFNLKEYLQLIVNLLNYQVSPFLTGRCLWTLSRYVESDVSNFYFAQLVNTAIDSLSDNKPHVLKVCAIRSIFNFYTYLKEYNNERKNFVVSKLDTFLDLLIQFMPVCQNSLLGLILETFSAMLAFDINISASISPKIIPLVIALLLKYHDDRFILELVQDILKLLSQNPYSHQPLQEKIVPTLISILNLQGEKENTSMQEIALDVLETIVKYSKQPLSDILIESAFPATVHCILRTEDHSVMQSGGECLRAFLFVSPEQVCTYKNGEGLNSILQVTTLLLNPLSTEYTAAFIGRLVITLITKAGNYLGEKIDLLLKAVISKMQLVESLSVIMSIVMIFAHLILIQMDAVLNFLSTVPGPTGEPAMNFVFASWLTRQNLFYGSYERRVSTMALCKLFEYGVTTKDQRLVSVLVKECVEVPGSSNRPRTRSQTQVQWISIPIMVKIFKLLINELSNLREIRDAKNIENNNDDEDDSDNEEKDVGKNLSAFMLFEEDETEEEDNQLLLELQQDPVFKENMEQNLTKFLLNFSRDENFASFIEHLNENERRILENLETGPTSC